MNRIKVISLLVIVIVAVMVPYYAYLYFPNQSEASLVSNFQDQIYNTRLGTASIFFQNSNNLTSTRVVISPSSLNFMLGAGVWTTTANASWTTSDWNYYNKAGFEYEQIWTTWRLIEPSQNRFDFSSVQGQIDYVKSHNPNAKFFARLQGITLDPLIGTSLNDCMPPPFTNFTTSIPSDHSTYLAEVASYVRTLAAKYAGQIDVWITPIEINRIDLAMAAFNMTNYPWTLQDAIQIDLTIASAVKQGNPNAIVILGTSTPLSRLQTNDNTRMDPIDFEWNAIMAGVPFDDVAVETYQFSGDITYWYEYLSKMSTLNRPIFINEAGFSSAGFDYAKLESSTQAQTDWYNGILSLSLAMRSIIGFSFLEFKDRTVQERYSQFETMGLVDLSGEPKPSYYTILSLLNTLTRQNQTISPDGKVTIRALPGNYTIKTPTAQGQFQIIENQTLTYTAKPIANGQIQLTLQNSATSISSSNQNSNQETTTQLAVFVTVDNHDITT